MPNFISRIALILQKFVDAGRLPGDARSRAFRGRAAARSLAWRSRHQRRHGLRQRGQGRLRQSAPVRDRASPPCSSQDADVAEAEVAGPGFINIRLKPQVFGRRSARGAGARARLRPRRRRPQGEKVNVEYVSANPTGPMHVGHGRGAVFGDALASLLAFAGYRGDARILHQRCRRAGRRAGALGLSALPRGAGRGRSARFPEGLYPGDYLKPVGAALAARIWRRADERKPKREWLPRRARPRPSR